MSDEKQLTHNAPSGEERDALSERRQDQAFMDRLAQRMAEDKPLLDRIEALGHGLPNCKTARLVESRNGGALLVYECECGARLVRSREQAEADALGNDREARS